MALPRPLASLASIGVDEFDHFGCLCLTRQRCHEDTRWSLTILGEGERLGSPGMMG